MTSNTPHPFLKKIKKIIVEHDCPEIGDCDVRPYFGLAFYADPTEQDPAQVNVAMTVHNVDPDSIRSLVLETLDRIAAMQAGDSPIAQMQAISKNRADLAFMAQSEVSDLFSDLFSIFRPGQEGEL